MLVLKMTKICRQLPRFDRVCFTVLVARIYVNCSIVSATGWYRASVNSSEEVHEKHNTS